MAQSIRIFWKGLRWNQPLSLNWGAIKADSVVHISVSEAKRDYGMYFGTPNIIRFMGAARIEVRNVSPRAGAVDFFIYVDWEEPLDITVDVTLLDSPLEIIDVSAGQSWRPLTQSLGTRSQRFLTKTLSETQANQLQELILKDSLVSSKITAVAGQSFPPNKKKTTNQKKS